jgi:hypothetical protein
MSDSVRRAIRTFVQATTGILLGQAVILLTDIDDGELDWNLWKRVALSALAAGVIALITFAHNWAEDNAGLPAVLKATPSSGENPVTRDPAH